MAVGDDDTIAGTLPGTGVARAAPDSTEPTELLAGRYRVVRWLGSGGMGRVYEALDEELGERVALKMLRRGLSDEALERFRREVRLTRRIQHRNVARMFDIGEHAGDRFLTMELVDGESLTSALGERMGWPRLQRLAMQICEGLAAAHGAGVVHRDLKPDNVIVERATDRAVITDFGIARSGDDAGVTQVGVVIGTPRYMAPEQLAGTTVDARADLFSLGVMLYELAAGTRPWAADHAIAIAVAQATQSPRPLTARHVPSGFASVVMACLAVDPAARPSTATEIAMAIGALGGVTAGRAATPTMSPSSRSSPTPSPAYPSTDATTSLAVLPFACAAGDEYLAGGVQEDLTDMLATGRLRVRPPRIASRFEADPRELGRELDVDHVVVGSIRRTATGLRVTARLIGVADGFQLWSRRVDCAETEILDVCGDMGRGIAGALSTRATPGVRPTDPRAVELYLRARDELRRFWGAHAQQAAELLEQAAAYAPDYPPILTALAVASAQAWIKTGTPELLAPARRNVERALATGHAEAHLGSAMLRLNQADPEGAATDLGIALAGSPMSPIAHEIAGFILLEVSAAADSRHHLDTAVRLDPGRAPVIAMSLARLDAIAGDWEGVDRQTELLLADPDPSIAQSGLLVRSRFAVWRRDILGAVVGLRDAPRTRFNLGGIFAIARRWSEDGTFDDAAWSTVIESLFDPNKPRRLQLVFLQRAIEITIVIDQRDRALDALVRCIDFGLIDIEWFERCPLLADLHAQPAAMAAREVLAARAGRVLAAFRAAAGPARPA